MLIKGLIFFFAFLLIIRWLLRPFLSGLSGQQVHQRTHQQRPNNRRAQPGNVQVESEPDRNSRKNKTSDEYKGGDYIDFEEVD